MAVTEETEVRLLNRAKPCPFCDGYDLGFVNHDPQVRGGLWSVRCQNRLCYACGPVHNFHAQAVILWNKAIRLED